MYVHIYIYIYTHRLYIYIYNPRPAERTALCGQPSMAIRMNSGASPYCRVT